MLHFFRIAKGFSLVRVLLKYPSSSLLSFGSSQPCTQVCENKGICPEHQRCCKRNNVAKNIEF